jgi:hypothetical protein
VVMKRSVFCDISSGLNLPFSGAWLAGINDILYRKILLCRHPSVLFIHSFMLHSHVIIKNLNLTKQF